MVLFGCCCRCVNCIRSKRLNERSIHSRLLDHNFNDTTSSAYEANHELPANMRAIVDTGDN